jgi:uncharacterized protein
MSATEKVFGLWARAILSWPRLMLALALASVLVAIWVTFNYLSFSTDRTQLLDPDHHVQRSWRAFRQEFGGNTDMVVLVSGEPDEVHSALEDLAKTLRADPHIDDVFYKLELPEVAHHSLFFLSLHDLQTLEKQLRGIQPWAKSASQGMPSLLTDLSHSSMAQLEPVLPMFEKVLQGLIAAVNTRGNAKYQSPLPDYQPEPNKMLRGQPFRPGETTFYNNVGSERTSMLIAQPRDRSGSFQGDSATLEALRSCVGQTGRSHPRVTFMVSGEPVLNTDEMVGARDDATRSGATALVLVCILLIAAFGDAVRPACAVLSLLVGLSWSLALAAILVGKLNLLTVHFATILVGLSMTFAIQLLCHYQELRFADPKGDLGKLLEQTVVETGSPSFIGAITTAVAFWSLHFTNFRAAGELGLITGCGVLLTFLSITTIFPPLLLLTEGGRKAVPLRIPGLAGLGEKLNANPGWVIMASLVLTAYSLTWVNRVPFNYNMLTLQSKNSDSVKVEHHLQSLGYSTLFAVASASDLKQARLLVDKIEALQSVSHVETVASLIPNNLEGKQPRVRAITKIAHQLQLPPDQSDTKLSANQLLDLQSRFVRASINVKRQLTSLQGGNKESKRLSRAVTELLTRFELKLDPSQPGPLEAALTGYQRAMNDDLKEKVEFLKTQKSDIPDLLAGLPETVRSRSISKSGSFCLRIFPRFDCWEREPLEAFVHELKKVGDQSKVTVTGSPFLIYYYLEELRQAYSISGRNALIVICVLLLLHFHSIKKAALALFPKLLGVVWMLGAMGVAGVSFNAANFLALPITLGIGLIFGVNVLLECLANDNCGSSLYSSSTGGAVLLAGLATTIGFSSFLLANHEGVSSFGFVMAAGVGANLMTSLFTLPAVLTWFKRRKAPQD